MMRCKKGRYKFCLQAICLVLLPLLCMFVTPLRNLIFYPIWPSVWRRVGTLDVYRMRQAQPPPDVAPLVFCPRGRAYPLAYIDHSLIRHFPRARARSRSGQLMDVKHEVFLPALSVKEKDNLIWLLTVMSNALESINVEFFLIDGSLLGATRHAGIIPWDDDVDVALNVSSWMKVREVLSCIRGTSLWVTSSMHWRFYAPHHYYSYINLFFFAETDKYVWVFRNDSQATFMYPKQDVWPLQPALFEGVPVTLPRKKVELAKESFNFRTCISRTKARGPKDKTYTVSVPCVSLSYLYDMYYILN